MSVMAEPFYPAGLTARDVQLLQCLADGLTVPNAAKECGMSEGYAKQVLKVMRDKTEMKTTFGVVAWGFRKKVLT